MGKIIIDNNPITRWCFANIAIKQDYNENIKPVKGGTANQKIDGAIAMIEALGIYLDQPQYNNQILCYPCILALTPHIKVFSLYTYFK